MEGRFGSLSQPSMGRHFAPKPMNTSEQEDSGRFGSFVDALRSRNTLQKGDQPQQSPVENRRFDGLSRPQNDDHETESPEVEAPEHSRFVGLKPMTEHNTLPKNVVEALKNKTHVKEGNWFTSGGSLYVSSETEKGFKLCLYTLQGDMRKHNNARQQSIRTGNCQEFYSSLRDEMIAVCCNKVPEKYLLGESAVKKMFDAFENNRHTDLSIWRTEVFGRFEWNLGTNPQGKDDRQTTVTLTDFQNFVFSDKCDFRISVQFNDFCPPKPSESRIPDSIRAAIDLPDRTKKTRMACATQHKGSVQIFDGFVSDDNVSSVDTYSSDPESCDFDM